MARQESLLRLFRWDSVSASGQALEALKQWQRFEGININIAVVLCKSNPVSVYQNQKLTNIKVKIIRGENSFALLSLVLMVDDSPHHQRQIEVAVLHTDYPNVYLLISVSANKDFKDICLRLVEHSYPSIHRPFLSQKEMHELLKSLSKNLQDARIRLTRLTCRERIKSHTARRRFESQMIWTDKDIETVFSEAQERNTWFTGISFEFIKPTDGALRTQEIEGRMSKYGVVSCNSHFDIFYRYLILPTLALSEEKLRMFSGRSRAETPQNVPRPISIDFGTDVFSEKRQVHIFLQAMSKLKNYSCSVIHGNPYIHLSTADYLDGSSFDVWVATRKKVTIIPQVRATEAALKRLINHIFEQFQEGKIEDAAAQSSR